MLFEKYEIKCEGSTNGAILYTYILDNSPEININERPLVLICPGGGYEMTSDREGETVAMRFLAMGYHAAVLRYSVKPAVFPTALCELGKAVLLIRENAEKWFVDKGKIVVSGYSAGGHLAASYGCFWNKPFLAASLQTTAEALKPNGMILAYPVITSGEYAHHDSFKNLLGEAYDEKREEVSLEKLADENFPKTFVWHTYEDGCVPPQNSLLLVNALVAHHVSTEFHMFAKGGHGLSVADRLTEIGDYGVEKTCQPWVELAHTWMETQIVEE